MGSLASAMHRVFCVQILCKMGGGGRVEKNVSNSMVQSGGLGEEILLKFPSEPILNTEGILNTREKVSFCLVVC